MRLSIATVLLFSAATSAAIAQERKPMANEWPASASSSVTSSGYSINPVVPVARDGEIIQSEGGDAIPALPLTVFTSKSVKYVTGGVGDEEMAQLKSIENDFNMRVLIAQVDGHYIGDTTVRITDAQGAEVLTVGDAGPYFYASVMPGTYNVEVMTADGRSQKITTKVPHAVGAKAVVRF